jgi:hypothetical protein
MNPLSSWIVVWMLALVFGMPRFEYEVSQESYATVTTNSGSVVQRQVEEKIAPNEENDSDRFDMPNGDPGLDIMTAPKHPLGFDRLSP